MKLSLPEYLGIILCFKAILVSLVLLLVCCGFCVSLVSFPVSTVLRSIPVRVLDTGLDILLRAELKLNSFLSDLIVFTFIGYLVGTVNKVLFSFNHSLFCFICELANFLNFSKFDFILLITVIFHFIYQVCSVVPSLTNIKLLSFIISLNLIANSSFIIAIFSFVSCSNTSIIGSYCLSSLIIYQLSHFSFNTIYSISRIFL